MLAGTIGVEKSRKTMKRKRFSNGVYYTYMTETNVFDEAVSGKKRRIQIDFFARAAGGG